MQLFKMKWQLFTNCTSEFFLFTNGWGNFQVYEATYLHVCTLIIANLAPFSEDTKQLYNFGEHYHNINMYNQE